MKMPTNRKYKRLEITEVFLPRFAALSGKRYYPSLRLYRQRYRVHITPFITMSIKILTTSTVAGFGSSARNDVIFYRLWNRGTKFFRSKPWVPSVRMQIVPPTAPDLLRLNCALESTESAIRRRLSPKAGE